MGTLLEDGVEFGPLEGGMVMALTSLPVRFTPSSWLHPGEVLAR